MYHRVPVQYRYMVYSLCGGFHQASVQCKVMRAHNNTGTIGFLVNMSLQCYLPELGHGAGPSPTLGPTLGAGHGLAARACCSYSYSCCVQLLTATTKQQIYSYIYRQVQSTATSIQLQLQQHRAMRRGGGGGGGVWNMLTVIMHDKNLKEKQVTD